MKNFCVYSTAMSAALLASAWVSATDPTQPEQPLTANPHSAETASEAALPTLSLIHSNGRVYQAMLNGQLLQVGQQVNGYLIQRIDAQQVVLQQGERQWVLQLFKTITNTTHTTNNTQINEASVD